MRDTDWLAPGPILELLQARPIAALGMGAPVEAMRGKLAGIGDADFGRIADRRAADACRAALWLAYDFFDESHAISQELDTCEGSFWHAVLHRREPDPANANYWFRRVGDHPIFGELAKDAAELRYSGMGMDWSPETFVDQCEEFRDTGSGAEETCRKVQHAEWSLLFEWCFARAVNAEPPKRS